MSGDGKKVGVIGGLVAALGGAFAHGADDCARVGARGVAAEGAGVRAASNVGDDLARAGVRTGPQLGGKLGPGALGRGRVPGAPLVVPGVADDVGRAGAHAAGFEGEVGLAAVGDEVASGAKPWKSLAEELAQEVSVDVLSEVLDADPAELPGELPAPALAPPAPGPARIALVPPRVARDFSGFVLPKTTQALFDALAANPSRIAVVVGFLDRNDHRALALPGNSPALPLSTLHARAAAVKSTLWVLACDEEPCAELGRKVLDAALEARPNGAFELGRELVRARDRASAGALSIHGIARAKAGPRLVHSKL